MDTSWLNACRRKKRLADEDFVRNEVFSVDMKYDLEFESTFSEDLINCRRSIQADRRDASVRITPFYFSQFLNLSFHQRLHSVVVLWTSNFVGRILFLLLSPFVSLHFIDGVLASSVPPQFTRGWWAIRLARFRVGRVVVPVTCTPCFVSAGLLYPSLVHNALFWHFCFVFCCFCF